MKQVVFPSEPRSFPGRRGLKIVLRAGHVLCAGTLAGGYLLGVETPAMTRWLVATLISGLAILLLDLHESGVFLLQLRGWVVLGKVGVLAALTRLDTSSVAWVLGAMTVISVLSSHAPARLRYFIPLGGGGVTGARTKG